MIFSCKIIICLFISFPIKKYQTKLNSMYIILNNMNVSQGSHGTIYFKQDSWVMTDASFLAEES